MQDKFCEFEHRELRGVDTDDSIAAFDQSVADVRAENAGCSSGVVDPAEVGEASACRQPDIPGADDRDMRAVTHAAHARSRTAARQPSGEAIQTATAARHVNERPPAAARSISVDPR